MFLKKNNRRHILGMLSWFCALSLSSPVVTSAQVETKSLAPVTVALDWTVNTNHIGMYIAKEKGFYQDAGLQVNILPYSDTAPGLLVANGVADFGVIGTVALFTQRAAGADLVATYAVVQQDTGRLAFNADREDIVSPKDLDGKIYAGFGSNWERKLIETLIRHDGGKGDFEVVTLGTSAYEALANGVVDFTLEIVTWEGVKNELAGIEQRKFRYSDYGVPEQHTTLLASSSAYLAAHPQEAKAFLTATQRGYAYAVAHPEEAVKILIHANQDVFTDEALVAASLQALNDGSYLQGREGKVGYIQPEMMNEMADFLFKSGLLYDAEGEILTQRPNHLEYFTNLYLND